MEENEKKPEEFSKVNTNDGKKKSGKGLFIVIALLTIIIVALVGYIIIQNSNLAKKESVEESKVSTAKVEDKKENKEKSKNNTAKENTSKENTAKEDSKNTSKSAFKNKSKETNTEKDNTSTSSAFGKKNKNQSNTSKETNKTEVTPTEKQPQGEISSDWKSGEFTIDGVNYKLNADYTDYTSNGWAIDLKAAGYEEGYILNKNDKVTGIVDLKNDKFKKSNVNVGFINLGTGPKDITECQVWSISVDNSYTDTPVDFALPGGVKYGSSLAEIEAIYGKPENESNIYRSESLGYTTYTYDNNYKPQLRLTIYDDKGLVEFSYKQF